MNHFAELIACQWTLSWVTKRFKSYTAPLGAIALEESLAKLTKYANNRVGRYHHK
jgi:hypothetical protein